MNQLEEIKARADELVRINTRDLASNLLEYGADYMLFANVEADHRKLLAALEAVEALHESGHVYSLTDDGMVGDDGTILATFCTACTPEQTLEAIGDCEWTEDFETVQHPCPTITAITEALT